MTTPAINVNAATSTSLDASQHHACNGVVDPIFYPGTSHANTWRTETRPASVNHPRNRSGWRNPGPWNHSLLVDNPYPKGTRRNYAVNPGPGCPFGDFTDNLYGSGWSLVRTSLPAFPSDLQGRAQTKALLKLKNQQVNLAVAFAERRQTMELFSSNATSIAHQVKSYKRRHPKKWRAIVDGAKKVPNDWLELQYGWKPLISDVEGSCRALSKMESGNNPYIANVKGFSSSTQKVLWSKPTNASPLYGFKVTDSWKHDCRVSLQYRMRNPILATFSSLGLTNPFELAWEKLKYSFVIDWFLPVGNWLSTLDADFGWDFLTGTLTKFTKGRSTSVWFNSSSSRVEWFGPTYSADGFNLVRTVYSSAPWGGIPRFKNPLSGLHVANAVALLVQAFRR